MGACPRLVSPLARSPHTTPHHTSRRPRLPDNPLSDFVELPPALAADLRYSSLLPGVLRGSLEMLSMRVDAVFVKDVLNGDDGTEMRVTLREVLADVAGRDYRDD